ncbi:unnamed protein product [Mucor hiemalis]
MNQYTNIYVGQYETTTKQTVQLAPADFIHRQSTSDHAGCILSSVQNKTPSTVEERNDRKANTMDIDNHLDTSGMFQSVLVGQPPQPVERSILHPGDSYPGSLHRCIQSGMGDSLQQSDTVRYMGLLRQFTPQQSYQLSRTLHDLEMLGNSRITGKSLANILRQYHGDCWNGGSAVHTSNNWNNSGDHIKSTALQHQPTDRRATSSLEMGPHSSIDGCSSDTMEPMDTGVSLPSVEPVTTLPTTPPTTSDFSHNNHAELAERDLVSNPTEAQQHATETNSITSSPSCIPTIRRTSEEELQVESASLERKRQRFAVDGYDDNALHVFMHPEANLTARQYTPIQKRFLEWCELHRHDPLHSNPSYSINYLAYGYHHNSWKMATVLTYNSAILDLYDATERDILVNTPSFQKFFNNLRALTVRSFDKPSFDITPIIAKLRQWGPSASLNQQNVTVKLCFLLAITGFMRPSDIERIDLTYCALSPDLSSLKLIVDCPNKEKRSGSPIQKQIIIQPHSDPILCPLQIFRTYTVSFASQPCTGEHPTRPSRQISFLVRSLSDPTVAVGSQTIGRHINFLLALIPQPNGGHRPRARAVGSANAAVRGAALQDILTHGSWASSSIFDTFYRFSRATTTNFTTLSLEVPLSSNSSALPLDSQSESPNSATNNGS